MIAPNWDRVGNRGLREFEGVGYAEITSELGGKILGAFTYDFPYGKTITLHWLLRLLHDD